MTDSAQPWFTHDRFGMFVHWGLYSLAARHEWVQTHELLSAEHYQRYFDHFEADLYDPRAWARSAREAGMTYLVLTTKHHEGFCLWDSALTDFTSVKAPFGRDAVAEFVDAVRAEGLKVGFYHSLIDWHHPEFTIDRVHPLREQADALEINEGRDMAVYREYLHGQVRELLSGYGTIDYLFFDFSYAEPLDHFPGKGAADWASQELLAMVRELQPDILVNDRLDLPGDFVTPEQYQPHTQPERDGVPVPWEACQTLNGSWGYDRDNLAYKSVDLLLRMLIDGVAKNGNLLLNVGPTGRGNLDPRAEATLAGIGDWMRLHSKAIYGAGASSFTPPPDARYTQRGDRLYLHLYSWPNGYVQLPGLGDKVGYAQLLNDASEVTIRDIENEPHGNTRPHMLADAAVLELPKVQPDVAVPVIELFLT